MNARHLEFVVAVADTQSFSRAAARCHVTQPTLSNAVTALEREFGGPLFTRTTRRVALSPFGRHLLPLIEAVSRAHDELRAGAEAFLEPAHRMLRIGLSPLADARRIADAIEPFEQSQPGCRTFFKECFLDDLEDRLHDGQLDVVIRPRMHRATCPKSVVRTPFYSDDMVLVSAHIPPAAARRGNAATLSDVASETFVLGPDGCGLASFTRDLFAEAGLQLRAYRGQALSYQVMQDWADIGIGAAILPRSKISPAVAHRAVPLISTRGKAVRMHFDAVWLRQTARPQHIEALQTYFRERIPRLIEGGL